jgi:hypothetical protein
MSNSRYGLYQEQTLFDRMGYYIFGLLRRRLGPRCKPTWPEMFRALAAGYALSAAALITLGSLTASSWQQFAAVFLGAVLLVFTARQFVRLISPGLGRERKNLRRKSPARYRPKSPQPTTLQPDRSLETPVDFLAELRAAGINVRIAEVLCKAGFQSAQCVRHADDRNLLDVGGVGPATVRKLRERFGYHNSSPD